MKSQVTKALLTWMLYASYCDLHQPMKSCFATVNSTQPMKSQVTKALLTWML
jgi:hypothetical protein